MFIIMGIKKPTDHNGAWNRNGSNFELETHEELLDEVLGINTPTKKALWNTGIWFRVFAEYLRKAFIRFLQVLLWLVLFASMGTIIPFALFYVFTGKVMIEFIPDLNDKLKEKI